MSAVAEFYELAAVVHLAQDCPVCAMGAES